MTVLSKQFIFITCCSMKIICIQTQFCLGFNTFMDQTKISCELSHNMQEEGWNMYLLLNVHRLSRMAVCPGQSLSIYNTKLFNLDIRNNFFTVRAIIHGSNLPCHWRMDMVGQCARKSY